MEGVAPIATGSRRLSQSQAAEHLGVAPRTLEDWRNKSIGPSYYKLGKRVVYDRADLDQYLERSRIITKAVA